MARLFSAPSARAVQRLFVYALLVALTVSHTTLAAPHDDSGGAPPAALEPRLLQQLETGETDRFIVEFAAKADLSGAEEITDFKGRGRHVMNALRGVAESSQEQALALVAATPRAHAEAFWFRNVIVVSGDAALARSLAKLPGVKAVRSERVYPLVKPVEIRVAVLEGTEPEWGVAKIGADQAWADGVTGAGIVVANIDTGVQYDHPALVEQYRGNLGSGTFDHNYSWWDPTGICGSTPCDNGAHGTHTMGTIVGGDGPGPFTPDIGVAPGARWIAAKGCEDFFCTESSLLSSGQWILAPTDVNGNNPDPARRPDIVNNSWGGEPGDEFYLDTVTAWRAAGIIPVFSAGNAGPGCASGGSPGDYLESFSVGATDTDDVAADFSSRGPSGFGKVNPDVAAPGVDVISSVPGGGYESFSGTSMAAPHTAGALALVLSAAPELIGQVDSATAAVRDTALDIIDEQCGGEEDGDPNNVYGDGRIDAAAAVALVATGGTLAGSVRDTDTSDPIVGARVTANNGARDFSTFTNAAGDYQLFLAAGAYTVSASAFGYHGAIVPGVEIETDATTTVDFNLDPLPRFTITGQVTSAENGSPIEGASVQAVGTPVPPAETDATGAYELVLPLGSYTLRAQAGGCTDAAETEIDLIDDLTVDFVLARKLDDFGHACRSIPFTWVDAQTQSALFGDEFAGRLHLPFSFPFYGEEYEQIFISDNGYLNFLGPDQFNPIPVGIPSSAAPNAAIYPLWMDLQITSVGGIDYDTIGTAPNRAFVIEYSQVAVFGSSTRLDFEIKLWEDGRIDMLYGNNRPSPGDGRNATIGIENAAGDDALQFGFRERVLRPNVAFRYEVVPTGVVLGTVSDANDGGPVAGATITAQPGGRTARSDADGAYRLRLLPGSYTLTFSKEHYVSAEVPVTVEVDGEHVIDVSLTAPVASVSPTEISATTELGVATSETLTIANTGSAPLHWTARERSSGVVLPDLPPVPNIQRRSAEWGPQPFPANAPRATTTQFPPELLSVIIDDPIGDSFGSVDITTVRGGADGAQMGLAIDFSASTPIGQTIGVVHFDTDQDPSTGFPPDWHFGLPTQDIGVDYFAELFYIHEPDPFVPIWDANFELVAIVDGRVEGQSLAFEVPLAAFNDDDGFIDVVMNMGVFGPEDWAPDVGHGTIEPFVDAPWMEAEPAEGTVEPGEETEVTVVLGGPGIGPGQYAGQLVIVSDAPRQPVLPVDVALEVTLPESFGAASGTVSDAHRGLPLRDATVSIEAEHAGAPYEASVTTGADGSYLIFGPEGTWPATVTRDGYVGVETELTFEAGANRTGQDVELHRLQPHASLSTEPIEFELTPGRIASTTRVLGNPDGHATLTFEIGEIDLSPGAGVAGATQARSLPGTANPNARSTRSLFATSGVPRIPPRLRMEGDVLASWATPLEVPWGVGFSGNVWLSDAFDNGDLCGFAGVCSDHEFTTAGEPTGRAFDLPWVNAFAGDMAWDAGRGWLWQVHVGGDNGIYGLDPDSGAVQQVITGSPWSSISQRGLAYDRTTDTFYVGGWNEGIVYHVAGPSWPNPGETLGSCFTADPNTSGLAWNPAFQLLWQATNSDADTIYLIDPATCDVHRALPHPEPGFNGAGIEIDTIGNLWTVSQGGNRAYLIESGLPVFVDAPWLSIAPENGEVEPDDEVALEISVDSTGLEPGVYRALVVVQTNDPDNAAMVVPVALRVPAYQQGINAGGAEHLTTAGVTYAADRAYGTGGYGYVGGSTRFTRDPIRGTEEDALYQRQRQAMSAYRFDVPDGRYRVDLHFAEIHLTRAGARLMNVDIEGISVLANFDVYANGGHDVAVDRSFEVEVTDGRLDIVFSAQRGDQPIINAILVTHLPEE